MADEKKYYTFLNCNRCLGSNDKEFINVSTKVRLSNFKQKEANGSPLTTARACLTNCSNILSNVLGQNIVPDEYGNVWVDVTFWGDRAERFKKYLNGREKVRLFLTGVLTYHEFTRAW